MINLLCQQGLQYSIGVLITVSGASVYAAWNVEVFTSALSGHMQGEFKLISLIGVTGMLELFGGVLMDEGLFVHPTAFLLAGEMGLHIE